MGDYLVDPNLLNPDAVPMVKDALAGDPDVLDLEKFSELDKQDLIDAIDIIFSSSDLSENERKLLLAETWRIYYRQKPPTIEEFLTEEWIGPTANNLFPHVRKILTEYWQPDSMYRHLVLASAIGTGKSFASTISALYVGTHLWSMRDPKKFFGLSQATSIVHALISFSMEKAGQLLLQPFFQILLSSDKFKRVRQEEKLIPKQREYPDKICWTSAGRMGQVQLFNDIHYMLASSPANLLGLNMIGATLSEISFFMDRGFSVDYIWRIYQDSKARIRARFEDRYFAGTILDSSPNDIESSPIDKYIFTGLAQRDPTNYIVTGSQWDFLPGKFKEWKRTGETFSVFRGSAASPPRIVDPVEEETFDPIQIYHVPIDLKGLFEENVVKNVKDYCGWPGGSLDKLISDASIIDGMFTRKLKNIYSYVLAPSTKPSAGLIWNQIKNQFFIELGNGRWEFYRAPSEMRFLHIDQAETHDLLSITMVHPEIDEDGNMMFITDFNIPVSPGKGRINLNAIPEFLLDLRGKGGVNIGLVTFDRHQSSTTIQILKEKGIEAGYLSVDTDMNPYLVYIGMLNTGRVKNGRNIILKNNLKSIQETKTPSGKRKIDHLKGKTVYEDGGDWSISMMGRYAKDVSDSHCGAVWNCLHHFHGVAKFIWKEDIIMVLDPNGGEAVAKDKPYLEVLEENLSKMLQDRFGLVRSA